MSPQTRTPITRSLSKLEQQTEPVQTDDKTQATLPRVRVPVRIKITLPYIILALILALAAAYVVSQVVLDTVEERFTNQLIEAGKLANDWMVNEEDRLLETLRLVAYTKGVEAGVAAADAEALREIILPLAVNNQEEAIEILDSRGTSILSLRHRHNGNIEEYDASRGETIFSQWDFVRNVLEQRVDQGRDKYAGLVQAPWGNYLYVSGPIVDDQGSRAGVILVGRSLPTLVRQIRQDTLAHATIYDLNGKPIASTLSSFDNHNIILTPETVTQVLGRPDDSSLIRPLAVASVNYSEIVGPWQVRESLTALGTSRTNNDPALIGVSLAETFLARPSRVTRIQVFLLTTITFALIIILGLFLANRITRPLLRVVAASAEVAQGNLDVQVETNGNDEVAVLAHSFNQMVSGLREGSIYRDLLGRTVSPEVREQLRHSFASGEVNLEGQETVATVLVSNIRGFTTLSEAETPATILNWLNEYYHELVPIITAHEGIISKFEGDAILAFFGILPRLLPPQESAYQACQTALAMVEAIERLNTRRVNRGDPPFLTGVGINTGLVTAGGLGNADRLHYTVIGDTVNTTSQVETLTRQFGNECSAVISQHTLFALRDRRREFVLESMGAHNVRGKEEQLLIYQLRSTQVTV
jgi:adenylate cyclase